MEVMKMSIFQILDNTHTRYGKELVTSGSTIQPGLLVKIDNTGEKAALCQGGEKPSGFAFGVREKVYRPTTDVFEDGEQFTVIMGFGLALLSADFFTSGSLPNLDTDLYAGDNGKITTTSNSNKKFGHSVSTKTSYAPIS